jgi:diacylglycerol kinase family enzyme
MDPEVRMDDGLLDVFVIDNAWKSLLSALRDMPSGTVLEHIENHWQGRSIRVEVEPEQPFFADGESVEIARTPLTLCSQPDALKVLIPPA